MDSWYQKLLCFRGQRYSKCSSEQLAVEVECYMAGIERNREYPDWCTLPNHPKE